MKTKAIYFVILAVLLVICIMQIVTQPKVKAWTYHAVEHGDTLWSIAQEYNPDYTGDIRNVTYEIKKANGKSESNVYVGEVLEVPVMEAKSNE